MQQYSSRIFMVRPAHFAYNEQTAESNSFQNVPQDSTNIQFKVEAEFDAAVATLRDAGVDVWVIEDTEDEIKPDAIFPNNWISTHEDGTLVLYPMLTANRRAERRIDVVEYLKANNKVTRVLDLSAFESTNEFLEGTGSIVFDHEARIAYACLSPRTHLSVLQQLCSEIGYKSIIFHSTDEHGQDVYHTNVIMGVARGFVVVCLESVKDEAERNMLVNSIKESGKEIIDISFAQVKAFGGNVLNMLVNSIKESGKEIIDISFAQVKAFGGNVLAVSNKEGKQFLALSASAYYSFTEKQIEAVEQYARLLPISIPTIETIGGGSVRCMLAQNFLKEH